jgi:hypothetical protein
MSHKVLIALRNPFVKWDRGFASKPCLVWLTREDQYHDGRDENRIIGSHYLLMIYGFKGLVKWHWELNVLHRMHRPNSEQERKNPFVKCSRCRSTGHLCTCGFAPHSYWSDDHPPLDKDHPSLPCPDCAHLRG